MRATSPNTARAMDSGLTARSTFASVMDVTLKLPAAPGGRPQQCLLHRRDVSVAVDELDAVPGTFGVVVGYQAREGGCKDHVGRQSVGVVLHRLVVERTNPRRVQQWPAVHRGTQRMAEVQLWRWAASRSTWRSLCPRAPMFGRRPTGRAPWKSVPVRVTPAWSELSTVPRSRPARVPCMWAASSGRVSSRTPMGTYG